MFLQDGNVIIDFAAMPLSNALSNPNYVTSFLLFQFDESIKDAEVELMKICLNIQFYLKKAD